MTEKGIDKSVGNGTKGGRSMNHDGELNDQAQDRERPVDEELQADFDRRNDREVGSVSHEDRATESHQEFEGEKSVNHCSSTDHDPMPDPLSTLQALQEALERELWRFRKIKKEDSMIDQPLQDVGISSEFTSGGGDFPGPSTSEQSQSRDGMRHSFDSLDSEVVSLKQYAIPLQNNLCEAAELVQISRDNESELEGLHRQKIEAEVEYLTVSRAVKKLRVAAVDQVNLLEEQKKLASEQAQIVKKLGDAELKATMLKTQVKELENCCEDIMSIDVMLKLQKRICKYSTCFLLQLALLAVLGLFLLQIPYDFTGVVPT
ncbi:WPP domain-interacting protein 2-like [Solanum dulcamara]|uniref:WPP domain-interacting protein 2-like n=1 Tax=Solanum dulcamara TaxID=45834 RepID=UPI002485A27B|nr:WPP domain-interacting protein 2-like [Solanum dulcamara]